MSSALGQSIPSGRKILRRALLAFGSFGVVALVFCMGYVMKQPCPVITPARDAAQKAFWAGYPQEHLAHEIGPGSMASRLLCRMDSLLGPVDAKDHLLIFLGAVPDRERQETYYVFFPPHVVDIYYVYVVKDGKVMPRAKFVTGGA